MRALLDANVLLRHANNADPRQHPVTAALDGLLTRGIELCICSQNVLELWALATRPTAANGLGREPQQFRPELDQLIAAFTILPDPPDLLSIWLELCTKHAVRGRQCYDARLVALMTATDTRTLVTLNASDFTRYPMLELIVPGT